MSYRGGGPNQYLPALPDDAAFVEAVRAIVADNQATGKVRIGASANDVAHHLGLESARRLGNGAVGGSRTGWMSPALRAAPRLRALTTRGELVAFHDRGEYRWRYRVPR